MSKFSRLPPVKAMRALEALDRLRSAGAVAEEMSLTRSAVSHMLRRLEDDLGFAISEPDGRGIRLTVRGRRYAQEARRALDIMTRAAADEPVLSGDLKVVAPPGFATFWLADRIGSFIEQFPDINIHVAAARALGDITDETADVQIAFGEAAQLRDQADLVAQVALFPVCAPSALSAEPGLRKPSDLKRMRLLHLVTHVDWQRWLDAAGATQVDPRGGPVFSDMPMVQMAAASGHGVALGDALTARAALETGQLVRPFALSIPSRWSYFMRVNAAGPAGEAAQAFAAWIKTQLDDGNRQ
ncbi:MAG: LysR substrate-binding domain-containing protein [Pseudomonadota bacterium]